MKRGATIAAIVVAVVAAFAGSAQAKGIASVRISGPGLPSDGIRMAELARVDPTNELYATGLFEQAKLGSPSIPMVQLGPKYDYAVRLWDVRGWPKVIHQDLYPYAIGGPRAFTPRVRPSQRASPFISGWWQADPTFLPFLVRHGLPAKSPTGPPVPTKAAGPKAQPAASAASRHSSGAWPWLVVIAVVVMGTGGTLAALRSRRQATAA